MTIKMGVCGNENDEVYDKYTELCVDLNMDKQAAKQAWKSFQTIRQNYSLEGDQLHWLGCAFYVACRKVTPSTVGQPGAFVEGNLVSLTRLLRLCNLSLIQFFSKAKKWADMANLNQDFQKKIDRLERNFAVSMVIFKKFQPIFSDLFLDPISDEQASHANPPKKQKTMPCTASRLLDFCWTLFVAAKGEFPEVSDDLVNSYHLLLACCDYVFANALMGDRRDLLNPKFPGLPSNFFEKNYAVPSEPPCIIHHLCNRHEGLIIEAKSIKEYFWQKHIRKLFIGQILKGHCINSNYGILELNHFDHNLKAINKKYEEYVLSVGDFDERIFLVKYKFLEVEDHVDDDTTDAQDPKLSRVLRNHNSQGDNRLNEIGSPSTLAGQNDEQDFQEKMRAKKKELDQQQNEILSKQLAPATPLTGRKYLKVKDSNITPVASATQSVARLQAMLIGRQSMPNETLLAIYESCEKNPKEEIEEELERLSALFSQKYTKKETHSDANCQSHIDFAAKRLELAKTLFYKLLLNIILSEEKKTNHDHRIPLSQPIFIQTLFACCLEIVIYSYNTQRQFPWILDTLEIKPYHFYKVIEIIVRTEEQLSRELVKHLNAIEEQVLESLAWQSDSPLWDHIAAATDANPVPSCEDVSLPGQLLMSDPNYSAQSNANNSSSVSQSPVSERFQSPIIGSHFAKKKLFQDGSSGVKLSGQSLLQQQLQPSPQTSPNPQQQKGPKQVVAMNIKLIEKGGKQYISMTPAQNQNQPGVTAALSAETKIKPKETKKAKRTGSLALFFRKFYHLASVRMQELCSQLQVFDFELHRKIWTCFEHSIVTHIELMRDRHLDQLLMCAVYVICKIVGPERTFTEIMRCYRYQPQAASHVYRSVLLKKLSVSNRSSPVSNENDGQTPRLTDDERGDLIKFYNTVYVKVIQNFALKFSTKSTSNESLALSPLPFVKSHCMSPSRRLSDKHPVYIRSLDPKVFPASPSKPLSYCFSRSPAKDLKAINSMLSVDSETHGINKRLLADDGDIVSSGVSLPKRSAPPVLARKLQDLIGDRLSQSNKQ